MASIRAVSGCQLHGRVVVKGDRCQSTWPRFSWLLPSELWGEWKKHFKDCIDGFDIRLYYPPAKCLLIKHWIKKCSQSTALQHGLRCTLFRANFVRLFHGEIAHMLRWNPDSSSPDMSAWKAKGHKHPIVQKSVIHLVSRFQHNSTNEMLWWLSQELLSPFFKAWTCRRVIFIICLARLDSGAATEGGIMLLNSSLSLEHAPLEPFFVEVTYYERSTWKYWCYLMVYYAFCTAMGLAYKSIFRRENSSTVCTASNWLISVFRSIGQYPPGAQQILGWGWSWR